ASGATVYAAGTFYLSWGLDSYGGNAPVNPAVQQMMRNLLARFVLPRQPAASFSPVSLTFAAQPVGTTSTAQTVALTNNGSAALSISGIAASGDYAQTNNCGTSLGVGTSCTINVTFAPTTSATRTGTLSITDNASASPQTATLTGTGIALGTMLTPSTTTI